MKSKPLSARGFEGESTVRALERLYREGLTWPGMSTIDDANFKKRSWAEDTGWKFSTHLV